MISVEEALQYQAEEFRPFVVSLLDNLGIDNLNFFTDIDHWYESSEIDLDNPIAFQDNNQIHILSKQHLFWQNFYDPDAYRFLVFVHECFHFYQAKSIVKQIPLITLSAETFDVHKNWIYIDEGYDFCELISRFDYDYRISEDFDEVEISARLFEFRFGIGVIEELNRGDFFDIAYVEEFKEEHLKYHLSKQSYSEHFIYLLNLTSGWFDKYHPWLKQLYPMSSNYLPN